MKKPSIAQMRARMNQDHIRLLRWIDEGANGPRPYLDGGRRSSAPSTLLRWGAYTQAADPNLPGRYTKALSSTGRALLEGINKTTEVV